MGRYSIEPIRLSGMEAINFANSLFRPTNEDLEKNKRVINKINEKIKVQEYAYGFKVEITDLDLSFLNDIPREINVEVMFKIEKPGLVECNENIEKSYTTITVEKSHNYCKTENNSFLSYAA